MEEIRKPSEVRLDIFEIAKKNNLPPKFYSLIGEFEKSVIDMCTSEIEDRIKHVRNSFIQK